MSGVRALVIKDERLHAMMRATLSMRAARGGVINEESARRNMARHMTMRA